MPNKEVEKIVYTPEEFSRDVEILTEKIRHAMHERTIHFDGVFGMPRGGLVLAVYLSHRLKLPLLLAPTRQSLVVDDIADTGKTLQHYRDIGCFIVTPYYHPDSIVVPDVWLHQKPRNTEEKEMWIIFPWEDR